MTRLFTLTAVLLALAGAAGCTGSQQTLDGAPPTAAAPSREEGVHRFKLGRLDLAVINDGYLPAANDGKVWSDPPPADIGRVLAAAGLPTDALTLDVDVLLVRTGERVVLIDAGMGSLAPTTGRLISNLAKVGIAPAQVTDVIITHGHADHIYGLVASGASAFPNAKVRMTGAEWAALSRRPPPGLVEAIGSQVVTFEPGAQILPGLTAVEVRGHTPGHTAVRVTSDGRSLLAIGDTAHHYVVSLREPEFTITYDTDAAVAEPSRRALLTRASDQGERIFAPHFPFPGLGVVRREGSGFAWVPRP